MTWTLLKGSLTDSHVKPAHLVEMKDHLAAKGIMARIVSRECEYGVDHELQVHVSLLKRATALTGIEL